MAGSRFYLVREHFTNPSGFHTSCAASSTGITLRFGSDGVFVVASVGTLLQVPPAKTKRETLA